MPKIREKVREGIDNWINCEDGYIEDENPFRTKNKIYLFYDRECILQESNDIAFINLKAKSDDYFILNESEVKYFRDQILKFNADKFIEECYSNVRFSYKEILKSIKTAYKENIIKDIIK